MLCVAVILFYVYFQLWVWHKILILLFKASETLRCYCFMVTFDIVYSWKHLIYYCFIFVLPYTVDLKNRVLINKTMLQLIGFILDLLIYQCTQKANKNAACCANLYPYYIENKSAIRKWQISILRCDSMNFLMFYGLKIQ